MGRNPAFAALDLPATGKMRSLFPQPKMVNLLLLVLAGGVALSAFLAFDRLASDNLPPEASDSKEPYPFSLTPEFPVPNPEDRDRLRAIVAEFLDSPAWKSALDDPTDWNFTDVATLTYHGKRNGVYANVAFGTSASIPGPLAFVRCGRSETWTHHSGNEFRFIGLHVQLLDGRPSPSHLLPLNQRGEIPLSKEVQAYLSGFRPCNQG